MKNDKKTGTISTGTQAPGRCLARLSAIGLIVLGTGNAVAQSTEVVCTYAPSQSRAVAAVSGAAGGATADMVRLKNVLVNDSHTAEEVPVLAIGAGAQRIRGYFPNTHLFKVMLDAWGWKADAPPSN